MVGPLAVLRGSFLLCVANVFSRTVETYREGVWFYHKPSFHCTAQLGEVPDYILLPLHRLFVFVGAVCDFLRGRKEGVEEPEVGSGYPHCTRALEGSTEDTTAYSNQPKSIRYSATTDLWRTSWYSFAGRSSGCGKGSVGNGWPSTNLMGRSCSDAFCDASTAPPAVVASFAAGAGRFRFSDVGAVLVGVSAGSGAGVAATSSRARVARVERRGSDMID